MPKKKNSSTWKIVYEQFKPAEEGLRESLCTLANGYMGVRGAAHESTASKIHYPGMYMAGLYNRLSTTIAGRTVVNEDFVNCPNWVFLTFKIGDGEWFNLATSKVLSYRQELDMRRGVLTRRIRFQNRQGKRTLIESTRIVSMDDPHRGAFEYTITPENYNDWITVRTMLDGTVLNTGVERYRQLNSKHWRPVALGSFGRNGIYLTMRTTQSKIVLCEASRIRVFVGNREKRFKVRHLMKGKERIGQEFRIFAKERYSYSIEKVVSVYTSKDIGVKNPQSSAIESLKQPQRFKSLLKSHQQEWERLWEECDIKVDGHTFSQRAIRFHIFHLFQIATKHNTAIDAGIPARGLHGEAYRGHIFWDGVFAMGFYDLHYPDISKALLLYRYRRLPKARKYAKKKGYAGSMFPWQSGSSGREETQVIHLNPLSGKWGLDHSSIQRHVSLGIAYNVWQHWKRTEDLNFLIRSGAEIVLSIAQFISSIAKYDSKDGRFHIKGVMGPDEFHEKLPGATKSGLKDNAYTNIMSVWILLRAQEILTIIPERFKARLMKKIKLTQKELGRWEAITRKMNIIYDEKGIFSQFDGYFKLKELDWNGYRQEYGNIQRMDRILKAEGKSPDEYKVSKQADVLMSCYLLPFPEVKDVTQRLGCSCDRNALRKNYDYYVKRTSHGSTLSKVVHCFIAQRIGKQKIAWKFFQDVLKSDLNDIQGGTTPEGIHMGVMGGSIDIVLRGFAGVSFFDDRLKIAPALPAKWRKLRLKFRYKGRLVLLTITKQELTIYITGIRGQSLGLPVEINDKLHFLFLDKRYKIPIRRK